ncbi:hypothetical protein [Nonomuraea dietziae]|uniref:hypothetical protein n=1 Tax=Nonomuraea dietziae TaxID=65515 RepID=UPI0031E2C526
MKSPRISEVGAEQGAGVVGVVPGSCVVVQGIVVAVTWLVGSVVIVLTALLRPRLEGG